MSFQNKKFTQKNLETKTFIYCTVCTTVYLCKRVVLFQNSMVIFLEKCFLVLENRGTDIWIKPPHIIREIQNTVLFWTPSSPSFI